MFPVYGGAKTINAQPIMGQAFPYGQTISGDALGIEVRPPILPEVPRHVVSLEPSARMPRR